MPAEKLCLCQYSSVKYELKIRPKEEFQQFATILAYITIN